MKKETKLYEEMIMKDGSTARIIEYRSYQDIDIIFLDENKHIITGICYKEFKKGTVKNPYTPSVHGIGYLGVGLYKCMNILDSDSKTSVAYNVWVSMLRRCYSKKSQEAHTTYIGCSVINEWHNFQNFAKWFDKNYYKVEGQRMDLDKDLLVKGNKIYSPKTCVFVPHNINTMLVKCDKSRGKHPIGVSSRPNGTYKTACRNKSELVYIGTYRTPEKAFNAYKIYKENLIKEIADEYKGVIPQALYNALYLYTVEITD